MVIIIISIVISFFVALLWANGIDKMNREYPNYKGEDFLNQDYETEYHYYSITENSSSKKERKKKQVSQDKTKTK